MLKYLIILLTLCCALNIMLAIPLQKGMELRYEGEIVAKYTYSTYPSFTSSRSVLLLVEVLECDRDKGAEISQLTFTEVEDEGEEKSIRHSNVLFGKVNSDGRTAHLSSWSLTFPFLFLAPERLKEGAAWSDDETLLTDFFPLPLKGRVVYRVLGQSEVKGVPCWLLSRHLTKPVTLTEGERTYIVPLWTEWIWIDAQTGLVRKLKRRWQYYAPYSPVKRIQTTITTVTLKRVSVLAPEDQKRLQWELPRMKTVAEAVEGKYETLGTSEEELKQAEQMLTEVIAELRASPYANFYIPYLERELETVRYWQKKLEAPKLVANLRQIFELPTTDGKGKIKLSDLRGKIVLLNFFAYWCGPCNEEAPRLERIWREYKDKGVVVVGVAIRSSGDAFEEARKFIQKHGLTFPVAVDPEKKNKVAVEYRVIGVPTNVIVGKDRVVRYYETGFLERRLREALDDILKK